MKRFLTYIRKHIKELDYILIISFLLLGILGVIMVYSASMVPASKGSLTGGVPIESNHFMKRQFLFVVIGFLVIIFIGAFININVLKKATYKNL